MNPPTPGHLNLIKHLIEILKPIIHKYIFLEETHFIQKIQIGITIKKFNLIKL
jgi:hypothetical protein